MHRKSKLTKQQIFVKSCLWELWLHKDVVMVCVCVCLITDECLSLCATNFGQRGQFFLQCGQMELRKNKQMVHVSVSIIPLKTIYFSKL